MLSNRRILFPALLLLCSCGPAFAETPAPPIVEHGPRECLKIAITFDACPTVLTDEYDEKVIDVLIREKAPATLFMSGRWIEKNVEKTKFLASQPQFEIANHSYYHPHMTEKSDARVLWELKRTQTLIKKVTGRSARFFRPPFGEVNEHLAELAAEAGLVTIEYDMPSGDPDPGLSGRAIASAILKSAKGGDIIVFHMNRKGVHTAEILPGVIEGLRRKGFTLVTVGELLKDDRGHCKTIESRGTGSGKS